MSETVQTQARAQRTSQRSKIELTQKEFDDKIKEAVATATSRTAVVEQENAALRARLEATPESVKSQTKAAIEEEAREAVTGIRHTVWNGAKRVATFFFPTDADELGSFVLGYGLGVYTGDKLPEQLQIGRDQGGAYVATS